MPHVFSDSSDKRVVREKWNTPLLRHLHEKHGYVYRYFGLPGPDIIDIKLWGNMINEVVAFEVPAVGKSDERAYINELRKNLEKTGINNTTYYGSFEEVILLGKDFEGLEYSQRSVITLYNLDFCSEIGSIIYSRNGEKLYRFEAIRKIIRNQVECFNRFQGSPCFIILLTVRNQMRSKVLIERLKTCRPLCEEFINRCEAVNPIGVIDEHLIGTHTWALKTIIYTILAEQLRGNNISALFFPFVKYKGVKVRVQHGETIPSPMLHLMIFCKFQSPREVVGVTYPQNPLLIKSLAVNNKSLASAPEPGEEFESHLSSVAYFEKLEAEIL